MPGFVDVQNRKLSRRIGKALKNLSSFGMQYDDMVVKQSHAIGINEDRFGWRYDPTNAAGGDYDEYGLLANLSLTDINLRKNISFFDKTYKKKREELRRFAVQDEIEEILDILCDESIVYDDKNYFCEPLIFDSEDLKPDIAVQVKSKLLINFKRIYQYFGFNNDIAAWSFFRKWLIDGYIAYEIIYDEKQENIIGFKELDPITLEPGVDKDGKKTWHQFKGDPNKERMLYDSQIIYISSSMNGISRVSYVERLIRSFNLLRIMEHSRIIWAVVNASFKTKFIIPVGGKSKNKARQSLASVMNQYRENIEFDSNSGELQVNGKPMMPFNKEYWIPKGENGEPTIETFGNDGPDLSDTNALKYFRNKLNKVSKIPSSRFDSDSQSGQTWQLSAEAIQREEIRFSRFISRIRSVFQEIMVKPLWLQMCLDFPELKEDDAFRAQIGIRYNKYNYFDDMMEIEVATKRLDFVTRMKEGLVDMDPNMNEQKYFSNEFLIRRYMKFNQDDINENKRLKDAEIKKMAKDAKDNLPKIPGLAGGFGGGRGGARNSIPSGPKIGESKDNQADFSTYIES